MVVNRRRRLFHGIKWVSLALLVYALWSLYHDDKLLLEFDSWKDCEKIIWQHSSLFTRLFVKVRNHFQNQRTDEHVWATYSTKECHNILQEQFHHTSATETELAFPIAYAILVYKGGPLP